MFFSGRMGMSNAERQRKFREKRDKDLDKCEAYLEKENDMKRTKNQENLLTI